MERQIFNPNNLTNTEVNIIELRIKSLTANRNFFAVLFMIESAILAIVIRYFAHFTVEFVISAIFLFGSISLILLGVFSLTDIGEQTFWVWERAPFIMRHDKLAKTDYFESILSAKLSLVIWQKKF